jgi:UDP-glucose 4-epimerase
MDEQHACFPETVYGAAKLAGEAYARAYHQTYGLPTVVVRPFNNFGPRSHFEGDSGEVIPRFILWALNDRRPIVFGDGSQTRDFIYVEETAQWLTRIACCDALIGKTINLGSGAETSVLELARTVYEEAGCPNCEPEFRDARPGDVLRLCADAAFARETLGFYAKADLRTGIRKTVDYLRKRGDPRELLNSIEEANWQLTRTESSSS